MLLDLRIHSNTLYIYPMVVKNRNKKNRQIAVFIYCSELSVCGFFNSIFSRKLLNNGTYLKRLL